MTQHIHTSLRCRLARSVRAALLIAVATTGALAFSAGGASADERLATNALAPFVTSAARQALDSYDEYEATGNDAAYRRYMWFRTETARLAATELGYPVLEMVYAWSETTVDHQRAVLAAMTQVGVPYRRNTSAEGVGFDCSGLTTFAWQEPGLELFRQSGVQIQQAARLDRSTAKAGDLVQYPGHVMMYLGVGDAIIHSVQTGRTVELDEISPRRSSSVRFGDPTR
jgi:cell wall-associated NlpC family hydrolase